MIEPILILLWAWAIGAVVIDLYTPDWIVNSLGDSLTETELPGLCFLIGALISFFVGTSWGTMAIMFPLVVPLAVNVGTKDNGDIETRVIIHSIATILAGSVFGDHCSPISDTTVLSSIASGCPHEDHVATQFPYAVTVGLVSVIFCDFCVGAGAPSIVGMLVASIVLAGLVFGLGTRVPTYTPGEDGKDGTLEEDVDPNGMSPFENLIGRRIWSEKYVDDEDLEMPSTANVNDEESTKVAAETAISSE